MQELTDQAAEAGHVQKVERLEFMYKGGPGMGGPGMGVQSADVDADLMGEKKFEAPAGAEKACATLGLTLGGGEFFPGTKRRITAVMADRPCPTRRRESGGIRDEDGRRVPGGFRLATPGAGPRGRSAPVPRDFVPSSGPRHALSSHRSEGCCAALEC